MTSFNECYLKALETILDTGAIVSPRGMKVKEVLAYQFSIDPLDNRISLPGFKTNIEYAKEELRWYLSGTSRIDFSDTIKKTWQKFSDDGETVQSAYGQYLFVPVTAGKTQWDWVKQKLIDDPDTRQAVFNINQVYHKDKPTKDFPCTVYCQVFNRDGKLHWVTNMRSQDIYFGTRNDVYCFTELQKKLAAELGLSLGQYIHFSGSLHLYEPQFEKAMTLMKSQKRSHGLT